MEFIQNDIDSIDKDEKKEGIFHDLSWAFDSVSHSIIIDKLNLLGIQGKESAWFSSNLNGRKQTVEKELGGPLSQSRDFGIAVGKFWDPRIRFI